jgi:hypothetical protein
VAKRRAALSPPPIRNGEIAPGLRLEAELALYGCDWSAADFNDLLAELMRYMSEGLNEEQFIMRSERAVQFCQAVRARTCCPQLPTEMINRRNRNRMKAHHREPAE